MNERIKEYNKGIEEIGWNLEYKYTSCVIDNDLKGAYYVLGDMMKYRTIGKFDDRLSKTIEKTFIKAGIVKEHRFKYDLRKDSNYIGEWLYGDMPKELTTTLYGEEHISNRRDYGYCVDITVPRREFKVDFNLLDIKTKAEKGAENFVELYNTDREKKINGKSIIEEAGLGVSRIYEVRISGTSVVDNYRTIAYVKVDKKLNEPKYSISVALKFTTFIYYFIDIPKGINVLKDTIINGFSSLRENGTITIGFIGDSKKYISEQNKILSENHKKLSDMKYLQKNNIVSFDDERCLKVKQ